MQLKISRITDVADLAYLAPIEFAAFVQDGGHNVMLGRNVSASIEATVERQKKEFISDPSNFWIKVFDADANNRIIAASNWKIFPTYVQSDFEVKDKHINAMTAKDMSFMANEKQQEDAVIAMKGFVSLPLAQYLELSPLQLCRTIDDPRELVEAEPSQPLFVFETPPTHPRCDRHELTRIQLAARHRNAKEAYIALNLLFVDPEYHRKVGAGRIMVEWGNRLADTMMLPVYVEASKQGRGLYASCGFTEVVEQVQLETIHNTWDVADLNYPLMRRPIKMSAL